jgi:hypothetical protein
MDKAVEILKSMKSSPRISFIPMGFRERNARLLPIFKRTINGFICKMVASK